MRVSKMYEDKILNNPKVIRKISYKSFIVYRCKYKKDMDKIIEILSVPKKLKHWLKKWILKRNPQDIRYYINSWKTIQEAMKEFNLSKRTIYRYLIDYNYDN